MKIAVIGATGFVGKHIVAELLNRQHRIKAFARNINNLSTQEGVETVALDVNDIEQLAMQLTDVDVVISAYNAGWTNPNIYTDFLKGAKSIQEAAKRAAVKRLIVIGGAGSLLATPETQIVDTPDFPAKIKPGALAARDFLNTLKPEFDFKIALFD